MAKKYIADTLEGDITGNVTGSASLNVLKAGDTMTGDLKIQKTSPVFEFNSNSPYPYGKIKFVGGVYQPFEIVGQTNPSVSSLALRSQPGSTMADAFVVKQFGGSTYNYSAAPLRIGADSSSNELEDYEEGTYNIQFRLYRDNNSDQELIGSSGFAAWTNRSKYQKIGNTVTLFLDLEYRDGTSAKWNTSNTYFVGIDNLPFAYTQAGTNTRVPVGGTYALRSTYQSVNTGQTIFTREGGYSNYTVYISFGGILHSQYPSYALDPVYSNEWPQTRRYYANETVHLTGTVTYQTNQ